MCENGLFQKFMTYKLCQNANFKNRGTTIQMDFLHVLLNMLSISLLSRYMTGAKSVVMSFYILKKNNEMQVAVSNFWLVYFA